MAAHLLPVEEGVIWQRAVDVLPNLLPQLLIEMPFPPDRAILSTKRMIADPKRLCVHRIHPLRLLLHLHFLPFIRLHIHNQSHLPIRPHLRPHLHPPQPRRPRASHPLSLPTEGGGRGAEQGGRVGGEFHYPLVVQLALLGELGGAVGMVDRQIAKRQLPRDSAQLWGVHTHVRHLPGIKASASLGGVSRRCGLRGYILTITLDLILTLILILTLVLILIHLHILSQILVSVRIMIRNLILTLTLTLSLLLSCSMAHPR